MLMVTVPVRAQSEKAGSVRLEENEAEKRVDVFVHDELFTSYIYPETLKKPVLYPVKTAGGSTITRGFPLAPRPGERIDHPHHVGLWLNYGDVNGLDFWNNSDAVPASEKDGYGSILHTGIDRISSGDDKGELEVTMEWTGPAGEVLLRENTTFIFSGTDRKRTIERITTLTAADEDVSMKDNKEGMLGIRVARELELPSDDEAEVFTDASGNATEVPTMNNEGVTGMYRSSEGLTGDDVWGTRGRWMNLAGRINGENISVAILDHPGNPGYPTYWHARGYGLFAANPLGQRELSGGEEELNFGLRAGESVTFRYRVVVWSGREVSDEKVEENWSGFAND